MKTKATLVGIAILGTLVMGTAPATARPAAESYAETFSSTKHLHPRFPADFPIPAMFVLEHSTGGLRRGTITLRFRFRGDPMEAVDALRDAARKAGWSMEEESSYRILFHNGPRTIAAWFGFPSRSLVLDLREPPGPIDAAALPQRRAEGEAIEAPSRAESSPGSMPVQPSSFPTGLTLALVLIGGAVMAGFGMIPSAARAAGRLITKQSFLRGPIAAPAAQKQFGHHRLSGGLPH